MGACRHAATSGLGRWAKNTLQKRKQTSQRLALSHRRLGGTTSEGPKSLGAKGGSGGARRKVAAQPPIRTSQRSVGNGDDTKKAELSCKVPADAFKGWPSQSLRRRPKTSNWPRSGASPERLAACHTRHASVMSEKDADNSEDNETTRRL